MNASEEVIQQVLLTWLFAEDTDIRVSPKDYQFMKSNPPTFCEFVMASPHRIQRFNLTAASLA